MPRKPPLKEGEPVSPVYEKTTTGMHELTFLIGAFAATAPLFETNSDGKYKHTVAQINDRIIEAAADMLDRKESP
jgi:hypothetical protein